MASKEVFSLGVGQVKEEYEEAVLQSEQQGYLHFVGPN